METEYMTIAELKAELHIGNSAAYRLCKIKSFPAIYLSGRWLINRERYRAWMARLEKLPDRGASVIGGGK